MSLYNWAGSVAFSTDKLLRPTTLGHLQEFVASTPQLRVLGTGHSFSRVADTTGVLLSVADLDLPVDVDESAGTVTVPAGMRYGELASALAERDLALHNLGSLPHISVAGACSTGTHGSGDTNRCLAAAASGIELVTADGSLTHVTRDDPSFGGAVLALGALGVATRVTLRVEPAYEVRQDVWADAPLAAVADQLDDVLSAGYSVSVFTGFTRPQVLDKVWVKTRVPGPVADGTAWGAHAATEALHPIAGEDASAATQQLGDPGPWHTRLPHFRLEFTPSKGDEQQSEYLIPREHGGEALRRLATLDWADVLQVAEIRSIAPDDLWLSPCHGRDTVGLHFTWINDDARVQPVVRTLEQLLEPFDPRPHWGKVFTMDPARVRAHYPRLPEFADLATTYDPQRRFGNEFLETYVY